MLRLTRMQLAASPAKKCTAQCLQHDETLVAGQCAALRRASLTAPVAHAAAAAAAAAPVAIGESELFAANQLCFVHQVASKLDSGSVGYRCRGGGLPPVNF